jgi:type I restriction enzyme S subunit
MSHTIPSGWITTTLGECCDIVSGGTPRRACAEYWDGTVPWVTPKDISDIDNPVFVDPPERITELGLRMSSAALLPEGAILFSSRAPIGLVAIAGQPMATNQGFKSLVPRSCLYSGFLYYAIKRKVPEIAARGNGATFKEVSKSVMSEIQIAFPKKIDEQRRIAAILDKADDIRRKREQSLTLADDFLRSCYVHLVGYRHPEFGNWRPHKIENLAAPHKGAMRTGPFGSDLRHSEFTDHGIAVLGIDNAVNNHFEWDERRYISEEKYNNLRRYRVFPKDVIITIMGTTGRSAMVPDDIQEAITTKHLATITCDETKILPQVLSFAIHSDPLLIRQIQRANKGAIMAGLNLGIIKSLEINLPPLRLQEKFAHILASISAMRDELSAPEKNGAVLFESLSQRAFRGEL